MSQLNVVESFVVYDQSPAMFPGLTITKSGALLVSFSTVPDGLPGGEVHLIRSEDQGRTWSKPTLVANSQRPGGAAINAVGLTCTRNGTLLLAFNDVVTTNNFRDRNGRLYILHSTDEGATWQSSEQVTPEILEAGTYGNFIELDDGTLIGTVWGRWKTEERWRSTALFSRDGGVTWGEPTTIAYDPNARLHSEYANSEQSGFGKDGQVDPEMFSKPTFRPHSPIDGFNETSLIKLPDGRLLAALRQQGVDGDQTLYFFRSISTDGGRTWSAHERSNLRGMSPSLHYGPDGQLLLAYRHYAPDGDPDAQPGLSIATSDDEGLTWQPIVTLRDPKGTVYTGEYQVGYPALANLPDGSILVVFYSYDEALPWRRYLAANILR